MEKIVLDVPKGNLSLSYKKHKRGNLINFSSVSVKSDSNYGLAR